VVGGCRKLHKEKLHKLYSSPNIIRVIKSRRMRGAEHITHIHKLGNEYKISDGKPERKTLLGR